MLALVTTAAVVLGVILLKTPKSAPASSADGSGSPSPTGTDVTPTATGDTASPTATETGTTPPSTAVPASGFLGSLAASYTVTPAAVRTLAMPSSAIPSPSAAVSYIDSSWTRNKGGSAETLSFVDDPLDAGGGPVLQVVYKKGSYSGGGVGGIGNWQFPVFGEKKNRAVLSYEVGFSKDFDFVKGAPRLVRRRHELGLYGRASEHELFFATTHVARQGRWRSLRLHPDILRFLRHEC
ncbi:RHTO0S23e00166g2_1 [Rhodotorula toruloides]|uniref:RHTO0S23e00166g2_1 n=1 Tax=Rhodotorula toruloides TaxID=5286 RepID=A0A061BGH9_RHOTO|nr:RHTO0S23e00166g2_1 [Rhodotorula toruloides]